MSGREVREYTNLSDPKDKKSGKGKDKIDDEDITFQRMVAKDSNLRVTISKDSAEKCKRIWDLGFSYRAIDVSRCRKLQENVEVTFTGEALWTVMTCYTSRNRWKQRKMLNVFYGGQRNEHLLHLRYPCAHSENNSHFRGITLNYTESLTACSYKPYRYKAASLADSSPASLPLPLRVEPKTKSGIRQQDLLKNIVQIRPKRHRVSSPSSDQNQLSPISTTRASPDRNQSTPISTAQASPSKVKEMETKHTSDKDLSSSRSSKGEEVDNKPENAAGSLLGLAYESSDED
ncbi:hypothetical protein CKAN_01946500 [Cinnamomum micranthum f. kanehirae]|uniref:Uncharacterized protein n=1 Tax=Cinnamomum micranthum f. kanehirae TaxID=337451 RepID=A0A3S3NE17_9MAGN|nr:hypothetical protein CKAN_01946500 [Cinnamomum micranthum f. kanehirae]